MTSLSATAIGPAHWASYIINGDASSFDYYGDDDGTDRAAADAFVKANGQPVGAEDLGFCRSCDAPNQLAGNMCLYTFHSVDKL